MMACYSEDDFLSRYEVKKPKGYKPEPEEPIPLWKKIKINIIKKYVTFWHKF